MSYKHPIIAITGSSGAGTTFVKKTFEKIFSEKLLKVVTIEGDSFHKYDRKAMKKTVAKSLKKGDIITHFSEYANYLDKLAKLFAEYANSGTGKKRYYIHSDAEAKEHNARLGVNLIPGQFTPWESIEKNTDLMFYEGLHGGVKTKNINIASNVDLLVGVVPSVNIEWIQKIHRDTVERAYTSEQVVDVILARMPDYVKYITTQFDNTHINFQRIPLIDTSNPFKTQRVPAPEDSMVVTTVRMSGINLVKVKNTLPEDAHAFLQNKNTLVYKGNYMSTIINKILAPVIDNIIANKKNT